MYISKIKIIKYKSSEYLESETNKFLLNIGENFISIISGQDNGTSWVHVVYQEEVTISLKECLK